MSVWRLVHVYDTNNFAEILLDPVEWAIFPYVRGALFSQRISSKFSAVDLNHLKKEMINQQELLLEIQSFEDVAAPCVLPDA
jgi:hypothetical protein